MTDAHPAVALELAALQADQIIQEGLAVGAFSRAEVAGSIRRKKGYVHDIEIVATPGPYFGGVPAFLDYCGIVRGRPSKNGSRAPWSGKYFKGELTRGVLTGVQLDLFLVAPNLGNEWGVIYAIRTGSGEFSRAVVSRLLRYGLGSRGGCVYELRGEEKVRKLPCPTEDHFFSYAHLPVLPPEERDMEFPKTRLLFEAP